MSLDLVGIFLVADCRVCALFCVIHIERAKFRPSPYPITLRGIKSMQNRFLKISLLMAVALFVNTAIAGVKFSGNVYIDAVSRYAYGSLGTARNSADGYSWVTCGVQSGTTGSMYASCYAVNASGVSASCGTTNANLVAVVATLEGDSSISFQWDSSGLCTYISVGQSSAAEPKKP